MYQQGLFIDGFAGGGGASTGIAQAIGRDPDIAVNHSPTAIAIHRANHPDTTHYCQDIKALWPRVATKDQHVAGAWFSPDCKEYSKAKGGPVKDRSIRALCWEVVWWLDEARPEVAYLENVEEFEYAAPLDADGVPIIALKGKDFQKFVGKIRRLGYRVDWKTLRACDYGAPTTRKRLYMVMRRDKQPIVWPKPTHAPANDNRVRAGELQAYRTAAECIDWSIPCPSIFGRARDLAEATKRRIAHGVMRYVVNAAKPFIVGTAFKNTRASRVFDPDADPLRTVNTQPEYGIVDAELAPHITKFHGGSVGSPMDKEMPTVTSNGDPARPAGAMPVNGSYPTTTTKGDAAIATAAMAPLIDRQFGNSTPGPADRPLGATTAGGGGKSAHAAAFLSRFYGSDKRGAGGDPEVPLPVTRAGGTHHAIVSAHLEQANGGPRNKNSAGRNARSPLSTATTTGSQQRIVETTLIEEGSLPPEMLERAVKVAEFLKTYYEDTNERVGRSTRSNSARSDRGSAGRDRLAEGDASGREIDDVRTPPRGMHVEERLSGSGDQTAGRAVSGACPPADLDRPARPDPSETGHQSQGRGQGEQRSDQSRTGDQDRESPARLRDRTEGARNQTDVGGPVSRSEAAKAGGTLVPPDRGAAGSGADDSISGRELLTSSALVKYYGTDGTGETAQHQRADRPLDAITARARFAVVTVTIDAVTYVIVDIGLRMLKPRELANAQGFPADYVLDPVVRKFVRGKWIERPLTIAEQISAIGNSVCPPVAKALVAANQPGLCDMRMAA